MATNLIEHESHHGLMEQEFLSPVMSLALAKTRLAEFQAFVKEYLTEGEDFGVIPGTAKPTLLKPGADKLCELYGLADTYEIEDKREDFAAGLFDYTIRCVLSRRGQLVSTGLGSCNSYEGKYRWRDAQRKCPHCGKEAIIKGKEEYGGGWLCFAKKGGCGAKFTDRAPEIVNQTVGRVENDDIATLKNTILKMAKKRAKIDATLSATRSSGVFTQDVEDMVVDVESANSHGPRPENHDKREPPKQETPKPRGWGARIADANTIEDVAVIKSEAHELFDEGRLTGETFNKTVAACAVRIKELTPAVAATPDYVKTIAAFTVSFHDDRQKLWDRRKVVLKDLDDHAISEDQARESLDALENAIARLDAKTHEHAPA